MLNVPNLQLNSEETKQQYEIQYLHLHPGETAANSLATHVGSVDKWPQNHKAHRQFN